MHLRYQQTTIDALDIFFFWIDNDLSSGNFYFELLLLLLLPSSSHATVSDKPNNSLIKN